MAPKTVAQGRKRNYKREYEQYHGKPSEIARRSSRNKARRKLKAPKGMEVEHKNGNANDNSRSNLKLVSPKFQRKQGGYKTKGNQGKGKRK